MKIILDDKDEVKEFVEKVLAAFAKFVKMLSPTQEGIDSKLRAYSDVPIIENWIYIIPREAPWIARAYIEPNEFCNKRKGLLREKLAECKFSFIMNYGTFAAWHKLFKGKIREVTIEDREIKLVVVPGTHEFSLKWNPTFEQTVIAAEDTIEKYTKKHPLGEWEILGLPDNDMTSIIKFGKSGIEFKSSYDLESMDTQIRLRKGMTPPGKKRVAIIYPFDEESRVVKIETENISYFIEQYYRVLRLKIK